MLDTKKRGHSPFCSCHLRAKSRLTITRATRIAGDWEVIRLSMTEKDPEFESLQSSFVSTRLCTLYIVA